MHLDTSHINKEFIDECIETGQLQLSNEEKFMHYLLHFIFGICFLSLLALGVYATVESFGWDIFSVKIFLLLLYLIFLVFTIEFIQSKRKKQLNFTIIPTKLSRDKLRKVFYEIGKSLDLKLYVNKPKIIVGITNDSKLLSEKQRITIIIDQNRLLINSINNPVVYEGGLFGQNKRNVKLFVDYFERHQL